MKFQQVQTDISKTLIKSKVNVAWPCLLCHRFPLMSITRICTFNAADEIMVEILNIKDCPQLSENFHGDGYF